MLSYYSVSRLNPRQQEALEAITGPVLVLAGAGSGKTSVITQKIAYLIAECGLKGHQIIALTFTNKSAREMKERVGNLMTGKEGRGLTVSTFHNLGLNIIRKEVNALGYKPGFSIFDSQDVLALLKDLTHKEFEAAEDACEPIQHLISNWKNDLISPARAMAGANGPEQALAARVYESYQKTLKLYNGVDFDDLILQPVELFKARPDILEKWQNKVRYLLVDEYQDTNSSQYLLVKQLVGHRSNFTVVGDDDQSIYAWRGARPENLAELQADFPSLKVVKLEQNYRSTGRILKVANQLIANNPHEFSKALWSDKAFGDPVRVISCRNEDAEAERIATEILQFQLQNEAEFRDFAILYRSNHQARLMELKLQSYKVPYKMSGGQSFFSRTEVKDIMAYLKILLNPADDNAFLRIVNTPRREIGAATLEKLVNYANQRGESLIRSCQEIGLEQFISGAALTRVKEFGGWIEHLSQKSQREDPIASVRQMVRDMEYQDWLLQTSSGPPMAEKRMANVETLISSLQTSLEKAVEKNDSADMGDAVARLVLMDLLERQEEEDETDRVQMMTLHSAKGLEFPHVFLMGMEEELLPHRNAVDEGNVEEERRLAYVGITRAKRTLAITLARKRKQYGELIECSPSRFLDELPADDLEWQGRGDDDPKKNVAQGQATLAGLKGMFADL
ncbi:DNA helicase Rep [Candidatus Njordibacter sp. Uisw_056]|jgi:ATP-dependent DNA helicase Rep|uniref:DNA helicase Rep n=1 Tax=Candidatus Njordibacter sp. Uisw_056 TaxID=3230973 RepID=UPI003D3C5AEB|tara:strand:+ start:9296 stop:11332 length:2037 start_codon:yes stop_codon:yes gene_type:complete